MIVPPKSGYRHNLLLAGCAFSFACLQLLSVWRELVPADGPNAFFVPIADTRAYMATLCATLIIFSIASALILLRNRSNSKILDRLMAVLLGFSMVNPLTLNGLPLFERTTLIYFWSISFELISLIGVSFLILFFIFLSWSWPSQVIKILAIFLLLLLPFGMMQVSIAAWNVAMTIPPQPKEMNTTPNFKDRVSGSGNRLLWIIFDELDRRAIFDNPPSNFSFPSLTQFASKSLAFTNTEQAGENTIDSVTSMIIGQTVFAANPKSSHQIALQVSEDPKNQILWGQEETLFSNLSASGSNIGIAAWYFPYCRIFAESLKACKQIYLGTSQIEDDTAFSESVLARVSSVNPFYRRLNAVKAFDVLLDHGTAMATDPALGFVYLHVPLPHQPTIYDAHQKQFTALNFGRDGYFHNVAAVDVFLSRLRQAMEETDIWDTTTIVISGDHGWRAPPPISDLQDRGKIAFFIKMAQQNKGSIYNIPFSATSLKPLMLALSNGELTNIQKLTEWMRLPRNRFMPSAD